MNETTKKIDDITIEELKKYLPEYADQKLQRSYSGGRNAYVCPFCGSGTKRKGTGALKIYADGKAWHCLSCGKGGDIYKLIELLDGETNFREQIKIAANIGGVNLALEDIKTPNKGIEPKTIEKPLKSENLAKYKEYIDQSHRAITETDYFTNRGISRNTINDFKLGYDKEKKAVVIPYDVSGNYYITRDTETAPNSSGHKFRKPKTAEAGQEPIFNKTALYSDKPCFVCESPIDAISIYEVIGDKCGVIAIGGTGHTKLINAVREKQPECVLILSFDNDNAGEQATEKTANELQALDIDFIKATYSVNEYPEDSRKDCNDMLRGNREQFIKDIIYNIKVATDKREAEIEDKKTAINQYKASSYLADFREDDTTETQRFKTGFNVLDHELDGGLYAGLYIIGAISSMGKTSFILQMADQIAKQGQHVIFFTLEQGAKELIAKSISRYSYKDDFNKEISLTARQVMTPEKRKYCSAEQREQFENSLDLYYLEVSNNLWFYESLGDIGINEIKTEIEKHIELTGQKPIVFIDYLQILKPIEDLWTEKRNIDKAVLELKKISRRFDIPVVAVSSLNRSSYSGDIQMNAFKESGAIEYGSDLLLGLQPQNLEDGTTPKEIKTNKQIIENERQQETRKIELKILKNRTGRTGARVKLNYTAMFNHFSETGKEIQTARPQAVEDIF